MRVLLGVTLCSALLFVAVHCSDDNDTSDTSSSAGVGGGVGGTSSGVAGGGGSSTSTSGTGGTGGWGSGGFMEVGCQGKVYECGNMLDDDGDGLVDWEDPDCLGPCDNNEAGFVTNIPGGSSTNKCGRDCYFDQDSGAGNDDCNWDLWCDPLEPQSEYCEYTDPPPSQANCADPQSQTCLDFCMPLVPNGCDCFGCCELPAESGNYVYIGSENNDLPTCTLAVQQEPDLCHPCIPVNDCHNGCGHCELCLGKTELPADCTENDAGTPEPECPEGLQSCGLPGLPPCAPNFYCLTGCCVPTIN